MRNVWLLTCVVTLFGAANGAFQTSTPQACLKLALPSDALGLIGTGLPLGYALSCLLLGQLLSNFVGKHVLICGSVLAGGGMLAMSQATTTSGCVAAQLAYGVACGAFWPFASAWMLDFQSEGITRTRLLRHYNVAWTSGTAAGMLAGGVLCSRGWVFETLGGCGVLCIGVAGLALRVNATAPSVAPAPAPTPSSQAPQALRIGLPILLAACLANLMTLSLRGIILNNYAELNDVNGFDAERMGALSAVCLAAQLTAFFLGAFYEHSLGLRRLYGLMSAALVLIALGFAFRIEYPTLLLLSVLHGFVNAFAFQAGILAATRYFSRARTGTTLHEAVVGLATMSPLPAGWLVASMKAGGAETLTALRAPLLAAACFALAGFGIQQVLVSLRRRERRLLESAQAEAAH